MLRRFIAFLVLSIALPFAAAVGGSMLGAGEVRTLLAGNTMVAVTALERFKGQTFSVHTKADGSLTLRNFDGGKDAGVWEVIGDGRYCNQYEETRKHKRKCFFVIPVDNDHYELRTADGTLSSTFTVLEGNPTNL